MTTVSGRGAAALAPKVSVIIACRNGESTLGVQLTALAAQRCPVPWEVVVSDNGSTDGSVALAHSFASRLPGLTVVDSSARPGAAHARNVGARASRAPLLVFCDADDEVAPNWLAAMAAALSTHRFVAGRFESAQLNRRSVRRSRRLQQDTGLQRSPFGPDLPHAGAGNLGVDRAVFFSVGGFAPDVGCLEDTDLCWRIQLTGVPLTFCPDAVLHVRLRSSLRSMWSQGHDYGAAAALLEHRYAVPGQERAGRATGSAQGSEAGGPGAARVPRTRGSVGGLLWTLGWHVGHRRWRPPLLTALSKDVEAEARQAS